MKLFGGLLVVAFALFARLMAWFMAFGRVSGWNHDRVWYMGYALDFGERR